MNTKNLLVASLIGAVVSLVVVNVPFLNILAVCLLCVGFWGSALLAVWIYLRLTGSLTLGQAVAVGTLTGVWAGVLGFLLSFVGLAGAGALMHTFQSYVPSSGSFQMPVESGLPLTFGGVCTDLVFGAIGGLIGGLIFRTKK